MCNPIPDKVARNGLNCRKKKCVSVVSALIPKPVRHRIDISRERQDDQRPVKNMDHDDFIIYLFSHQTLQNFVSVLSIS